MKNIIKAGLFQPKCSNTRDANLTNITKAIADAGKQNLDLLVLPELHNGPYFCQNQSTEQFDRAETIPGYSTDYFSKLAKEHNLVIVTSIFEKVTPGQYFNTAVVFDKNGEIAGKYRKMHIPHDPEYNEKYYFTPGNLGFTPIKTSIGILGVLICWDQWFPEAARSMALAGAEILIYPTAIGWYPQDNAIEKQNQVNAWQTVQRGHAIANNLFVISCNRAGTEQEEYPINSNKPKTIDFWGNSFIAGPQGEIINSLQTEENKILTAELDLNKIEQVRRVWPFFRDRRTDIY
jgi:N-carbamoylputrescine amidase